MRRKGLIGCLLALTAMLGFSSISKNSNNISVNAATSEVFALTAGSNITSTSGTFLEGAIVMESKKNNATNDVAYNSNSKEIRYYYSSSGNGCSSTFTFFGITVTKIVITSSTTTTPTLKYNIDGGSDITGTWNSSKATISDIAATTSFKFRNANTTNTQLKIKSIEFTYSTASSAYLDELELTDYPTSNITVGDTGTFSYYGLDSNGDDWSGTVKYYSTDSSVLEVNETSGAYVAKAAGSATVTCKASGVGDGDADVTSIGKTITVDALSFSNPLTANPTFGSYATNMYIGGANATQDLTINYAPTNCDEKISVTSSNSDVLTISEKTAPTNGSAVYTLQAVSAGTATVKIEGALGVYSATTSNITVANKAIDSIVVSGEMSNKSYSTIDSWSSNGLTVEGTYNDGSKADVTSSVTWTYSPATPRDAGIGSDVSVVTTATLNGRTSSVTTNGITITKPNYIDTCELDGKYMYIKSGDKYLKSNSTSSLPSVATKDEANYYLFELIGNNTYYITTVVGTKEYMYTTSSNNGLRFKSDNSGLACEWTVIQTSTAGEYNVSVNTDAVRYLCCYKTQDFRTYTTKGTTDASAVISFEEYAAPTKPNTFSLDVSSYTLTSIGATKTFTPNVLDVNGNNATSKYTINWVSSDSTVVTVNNGVMEAVAPGTATITATIPAEKTETGSDLVATCSVTVRTLTINYTGTRVLTVDYDADLGSCLEFSSEVEGDVTYKWSSSNSSIINISEYGDIYAFDFGNDIEIKVEATDKDGYVYVGTILFDVKSDLVEPASVKLNKESLVFTLGNSADTVTYRVYGEDGTTSASAQAVTVSEAQYVSISDDGTGTLTITPVAVGSEIIYVNYVGGTDATKKAISVNVSYATLTDFAISADKTNVYMGDYATITVSHNAYSSIEGISFTVSDDTVASISKVDDTHYKLVPAKQGNVTVKAAVGDKESNELSFAIADSINSITVDTRKSGSATWNYQTSSLGKSGNPESTVKDDKNNSWSVTHSNATYLADNKVGSGNNPDDITFTSSAYSAVIKTVTVDATTSKGHICEVTVGGHSYGSKPVGSSTLTFVGSASGEITIAFSNSKGQFTLNSFIINYEEGSITDYANNSKYMNAQKAVIEFAKLFMDTMEPYCVDFNTKDPDFRDTWDLLALEYDDAFGTGSSLSADDIAAAKAMIGNATAVTKGTDGSDILQNALARYELILTRDASLDAFMARTISQSSRFANTSNNEGLGFEDEDSSSVILAITALSAGALGVLYLLKKKRLA